MDEDYVIIQEILIALFQLHKNARDTQNPPAGYYELYGTYVPIDNENQIIHLMKKLIDHEEENNNKPSHTSFKSEKTLYLPFIARDRQFIPIFTLKRDHDEPKTEISFYIMLCRYLGKDLPPEHIGFRFEAPHEGSEHNYWHVQIVKNIAEIRTSELPKSPDPLPTTYPCIPVKARCPVSLFLCMLLSFYGSGIFEDIRGSIQRHHLKKFNERVNVLRGEIYS